MSEESCHLVRRRTSPPPGAVFQARFLDNPRGRQHLTKCLRKALSEMCPKPTFFWHRHLFQLWRYRAWEISPRVCDIRRGIHTVIRFWLTGWAHQPLHQSTIASINHCMYRPLHLSTIASINHRIYQPLHLSTIASTIVSTIVSTAASTITTEELSNQCIVGIHFVLYNIGLAHRLKGTFIALSCFHERLHIF